MTPKKPTTQQSIVVLLGDIHRAEMRPLARWVEKLVTGTSRLIRCSDVDSLLNHDSQPAIPIHKMTGSRAVSAPPMWPTERPVLIIVLQSSPDEFSAHDVNRLLSFAPLARLVVCFGSWCESLNRNRDLWPLAVSVPLWSAPARIQREWQSLQPNSSDALPWTASREEIFAFDHAEPIDWLPPETVQIDSPDPAYQRYLQELTSACGVSVTPTNPTLLLWDADPWITSRAESLKQYQQLHPQVAVVALIDQVQQAVVSELIQVGVTEIVLKLGFHHLLIERGTLTT